MASPKRPHDNTYDPHVALPLDDRKRRLIFRAWHRGIKELDLIFGNFVEQNITGFSEDDIIWFERIFEEQDHEILAWVTKGEPVPEEFDTPLMHRIQALDFLSLQAR